jgi:hypothetical protein
VGGRQAGFGKHLEWNPEGASFRMSRQYDTPRKSESKSETRVMPISLFFGTHVPDLEAYP